MARYTERIDTTEQAIRDFAAGLRMVAAAFDKQADTMKEFGLPSVEVTHWKSAKKGVAGFAAFAGAIQDAILQSKVSAGLDAMPISVDASRELTARLIAADQQARPKLESKAGTKKKSKP